MKLYTISPVFDNGNDGAVLAFEDLSDINMIKSTFKNTSLKIL